MRLLGQIHAAGVTVITIAVALFKIMVGLLMTGGAIWLIATDFAGPGGIVLAIVLIIMGVTLSIGALGVFGGGPSIGKVSRYSSRKALRRAGMLGKR